MAKNKAEFVLAWLFLLPFAVALWAVAVWFTMKVF